MPDPVVEELEIKLLGKDIYIRGVWVEEYPGQYYFYLNDLKHNMPISILGVAMHVIAVVVEEGDKQRAKNPLNGLILQDLGRISPHGNPFDTCMINNEECVLCMVPYTR